MNAGENNPRTEEASEFLTENMAEVVKTEAIAIIADWLSGWRDGYAEAKAHRELMELAARCETQMRKAREEERAEVAEMRDFHRRHAA